MLDSFEDDTVVLSTVFLKTKQMLLLHFCKSNLSSEDFI